MSDQLQVDVSKLHQASRDLQTVGSDIRSIASNLGSAAHSAASGWSGSSEGAFMDMWNRWSSAMGKLVDALETTGRNLGSAGDQYEQTDKTAVPAAK